MLFFITGPGRTIWRAWKLGLKSGKVEELGRHEVVIKKKVKLSVGCWRTE